MVLKGDALFLECTVNLPVALVAVVLGLDGGDGFHDFLEHLFDSMDTATKEAFFTGMKQIENNLDKILEDN